MPNFNPENPFEEKFNCDNDTQARFVSLFSELALSGETPTGDDLVQEIKETMSPKYLVDPEICKKNYQSMEKSKHSLKNFDVQVPVTAESGTLVAKRLICRIWNEPEFEEDRKDALEIFDTFRNGTKGNNSRQSIDTELDKTPNQIIAPEARQLSNDVLKRFNSEKSKFIGASSECWPKLVESFTRMSIELELSNNMKRKFFHHLLRDFALKYYRDNIENNAKSCRDIIQMMNNEFCTPVKMEAVARKIESNHISQFQKKDLDEEESLQHIAKTMQELNPQTPLECQTDRYRKNILFNATKSREWALNISSSSYFHKLTYQELLHELENSLQQYKIHKDVLI